MSLTGRENEFGNQAGRNPDWWGEIDRVPVGLDEDRYVKSVEIVEVDDVDNQAGTGRETVGGRYIFHHMIWSTAQLDENGDRVEDTVTSWPVHEVGRNPDLFDPDGGRLLRADTYIYSIPCICTLTASTPPAIWRLGSAFIRKAMSPSTSAQSWAWAMASTSV